MGPVRLFGNPTLFRLFREPLSRGSSACVASGVETPKVFHRSVASLDQGDHVVAGQDRRSVIGDLVTRFEHYPVSAQGRSHFLQVAQQGFVGLQGEGGTGDVLDGIGDGGKGLQWVEPASQGAMLCGRGQDIQGVSAAAVHHALSGMPLHLGCDLGDDTIRGGDEDEVRDISDCLGGVVDPAPVNHAGQSLCGCAGAAGYGYYRCSLFLSA